MEKGEEGGRVLNIWKSARGTFLSNPGINGDGRCITLQCITSFLLPHFHTVVSTAGYEVCPSSVAPEGQRSFLLALLRQWHVHMQNGIAE